MADTSTATRPPAAERPANTAAILIATVEATLRDLHAGDPALPPVTMDSVLDQDLGFDSLGRMELLLRTERAFGIDLPADTLQSAETVGDLLRAVQRGVASHDLAGGRAAPVLPLVASLNLTPARPDSPTDGDLDVVHAGTPQAATTLLEVLAWHVRAHPEQTQIVVLQDDSEQTISYGQLATASAAVAAGLQRMGVVPRQSVAIMLPTSADYFSTYFGTGMAPAIRMPKKELK